MSDTLPDNVRGGAPMVTEVRIRLTRKPPILAFVAITLFGAFVIHDLRLLQRRDGTRVVLMPRLPNPEGGWTTCAHPIQERVRREIERRVLKSYQCAVDEREQERKALADAEAVEKARTLSVTPAEPARIRSVPPAVAVAGAADLTPTPIEATANGDVRAETRNDADKVADRSPEEATAASPKPPCDASDSVVDPTSEANAMA